MLRGIEIKSFMHIPLGQYPACPQFQKDVVLRSREMLCDPNVARQ